MDLEIQSLSDEVQQNGSNNNTRRVQSIMMRRDSWACSGLQAVRENTSYCNPKGQRTG